MKATIKTLLEAIAQAYAQAQELDAVKTAEALDRAMAKVREDHPQFDPQQWSVQENPTS